MESRPHLCCLQLLLQACQLVSQCVSDRWKGLVVLLRNVGKEAQTGGKTDEREPLCFYKALSVLCKMPRAKDTHTNVAWNLWTHKPISVEESSKGVPYALSPAYCMQCIHSHDLRASALLIEQWGMHVASGIQDESNRGRSDLGDTYSHPRDQRQA